MFYQSLPTSRIPAGTCISKAFPTVPSSVDLDSPAVESMTDLVHTKAATIDPSTSLYEAEQHMIHQGVRLLFVVTKFPCVDGVITSYDLQGDKPLQLITQRRLLHADLRVSDLMTPLSELDTIGLDTLAKASVGQVMSTFAKTGHLHLLVLEGPSAASPSRIRGLISKSQFQRQLGWAVEATEIAHTFTELSIALG
jgi:CBS-domain-containing membrane protein